MIQSTSQPESKQETSVWIKSAQDCVDEGWVPLKQKAGTKGRLPSDYLEQAKQLSNPAGFKKRIELGWLGEFNLGILCGAHSGDTVDFDLDSPEAIKLADLGLLPPTRMFGRPSKRRSHYLYKVPGMKSAKIHFRDSLFFEVRSTGAQTIIPPSVHTSGERIDWDEDVRPVTELTLQEAEDWRDRLAAACILLQLYPKKEGKRHDFNLRLAGGLCWLGWSKEEIESFMGPLALAAGDSKEHKDRIKTIESSAEAFKAKKNVVGWPSLAKLVGDEVFMARSYLSNGKQMETVKEKKTTQVQALIDIARDAGCQFVRDDQNIFYVRFNTGKTYSTCILTREKDGYLFQLWLIKKFYDATGKTVSRDKINQAIDVMSTFAAFESEARKVFVRIGHHDGNHYLDLHRDDGKAILIRPGSWEIVEQKDLPIYFLRSNALLPMPIPDKNGSIEPLRKYLNLPSNTQWHMCCAWLVSCLTLSRGFPLLCFAGLKDKGKSTAALFLCRSIDWNVDFRALPGNTTDLMIAAYHSHVLFFDNVGDDLKHIGAICRAVTGSGLTCRELYTNKQECIMRKSSPLVMTTINPSYQHPDLVDRMMVIKTAKPKELKTDEELEGMFEQEHPSILGGILNLTAKAMTIDPGTLSYKPRMFGFAKIGVAVEMAAGFPKGAFLRGYRTLCEESDKNALLEDAIGPAMVQLFDRYPDGWEEDGSTLLQWIRELTIVEEDKTLIDKMPKNLAALGKKLNMLAGTFKSIGFEMTKDCISHKTIYKFDPIWGGKENPPCFPLEDEKGEAEEQGEGTKWSASPLKTPLTGAKTHEGEAEKEKDLSF